MSEDHPSQQDTIWRQIFFSNNWNIWYGTKLTLKKIHCLGRYISVISMSIHLIVVEIFYSDPMLTSWRPGGRFNKVYRIHPLGDITHSLNHVKKDPLILRKCVRRGLGEKINQDRRSRRVSGWEYLQKRVVHEVEEGSEWPEFAVLHSS